MKKSNLNSILKQTAKKVDPAIKKVLISEVGREYQELVNYQIKTGGKKVRPALTILSCQMLGGKLEDSLYPAAAVEILHNYTLIVDDIIDNGKIRRGKKTCWVKFGDSIAQCIGGYYAASIFQAAYRSKDPEKVSQLLAQTLKKIIDGEILDILFEQTGREKDPYVVKKRYSQVRKEDYFKMIERKTAILIKTSCELGGICARAKKKEISLLKSYGLNMGMAFQVRDDILDVFGKEKTFGKKIGGDIAERKLGNIILLLALKELSSSQKKKFLKIMRKKEISASEINQIIKMIRKTKAKEEAVSMGEEFIVKAEKSLSKLPQNSYSEVLAELAQFVFKRER